VEGVYCFVGFGLGLFAPVGAGDTEGVLLGFDDIEGLAVPLTAEVGACDGSALGRWLKVGAGDTVGVRVAFDDGVADGKANCKSWSSNALVTIRRMGKSRSTWRFMLGVFESEENYSIDNIVDGWNCTMHE
jgi:hypothetical protein